VTLAMGVFAGLLAMSCWGTAIFLAAIAARKLGNVLTLFWMQLFGFLAGLGYFFFNFNSFVFTFVPKNVLLLIAVAVLQAVAYLAFYRGLEKAEVSLVGPVGAAWGLVVALLGVIFLKETLNTSQALAIVLIIIGIALLSVNLKDLIRSKKVGLLVGVREGIIAMLGWGVSLFLLVIATKDLGWFLPAFIFRFFVLLILVLYIASLKKTFIPKSIKFPLKLLFAIGIFDIGGFFSYSFGVSSAYASIVAPIGSAFALVSVILAKIFLREKIDLGKSLGILAIVGGLVLMSS
jgi:drug/metabolite transporter (DMT)-like permease